MIHFNCKACGVRLKCSAGRPGRTKRCPKCLKQVAVPESETPIPDSTNSGSLFNSDNSPASGSSAKIFFTCKSCGNGLNFPVGFAGRSVPCPKCLKQVTIPESETFGPDPANSDNPFNSDDLDATVTDAVTESTEPNQTMGTLGSLNNSPPANASHLTGNRVGYVPFRFGNNLLPADAVHLSSFRQRTQATLRSVFFVLFFVLLPIFFAALFIDPQSPWYKLGVLDRFFLLLLSPIGLGFPLLSFFLFLRYIICKVYTWYGYTKKCPSCSRLWAKKLEKSDLVDERGSYMTVERRDSHRNSKGEEVGHTYRQEQVNVVVQTYHNHYICSFCPHRWFNISIKTPEINPFRDFIAELFWNNIRR